MTLIVIIYVQTKSHHLKISLNLLHPLEQELMKNQLLICVLYDELRVLNENKNLVSC